MQEPSSNVCLTVDNNNQHNNAFTHTHTHSHIPRAGQSETATFFWLSERGFLAKNRKEKIESQPLRESWQTKQNY